MYQKHILDLLRGSKELRYRDLQPEGVESSHFKYHLDQLQQDGLVARIDRGVYALTEKGRATVDRLSTGRINPHQTPKVITYTLLERDGLYYMYRKDKEPFLGTLNMIAGKVHMGERTYDAAMREVREKTGLAAINLRHRLIAEVRIRENNQLVSHFVAYVFVASFDGDPSALEEIAPADLAECTDLASDLLPLITAINTDERYVDLDLVV